MGVATAARVVEENSDIIVGVCAVSSQSAHTNGLTKIKQGARVLLLHHADDQILPRRDSADLIYHVLKSENIDTELRIFGEKRHDEKNSSTGLECLREHTLFDEIDGVFKSVRMFIREVLKP